MADLRMPEINNVTLAGNLTRDPAYKTSKNGNSLIHFTIASNKRYRDKDNKLQEDVCFINVIARSKLADSCKRRLHKGKGVLVEGELQNRNWRSKNGKSHQVVEIKARRIQFLDKAAPMPQDVTGEASSSNNEHKVSSFEDEQHNQFISSEESELVRRDSSDI